MAKLKLFLFGTPQLELDHQPLSLERRKAMALLAYLAITGESHSRETLAALLWPEADQNRARSDLRRDLSILNRTLGNGWLKISREVIGLNNRADLWIDVQQFRRVLAACRDHGHASNAVCPDCLPHLKEAAALYRADFLAGFTLRDSPSFDEWQQFQTEELRRELGDALAHLVRGQSGLEDFKTAIPYARRWLAMDPLHEPAHRQLMELYGRAGQRAAALHQYQECVNILQEELAVPPGLETSALAERIRLDTEGQQGQLIRSYELKELIGAGGFGEIYQAYQPQVRREVAIKVILPQYANQPEFIRRFETEARMVAQLEHPHIVPLYDYWREPDGAYLVMRWLRGGSLEDALNHGPWDPQATLQMLEQIAKALMLAHQRGIIHRDLKPANILLDESGNAYLTDFGIAKHVTAIGTQTQAGVVLGSPAYIAPENINDETLTPQTDIYSLGVILFEVLTGRHPFSGTTPPKMMVKHLMEPLPSLQTFDPKLPATLDEIIQKATAKNAADRYPDSLSLAAAFRKTLLSDQTSVMAQPDDSAPLLVPNPYKGLRAFQEADADDFFGRDALVEQLLVRLMLNIPTQRPSSLAEFPGPQSTPLQNFLAVVGPSGSGKSSLVKAGLIPALRRDAIPGAKNWFIVEMTPGHHPFEELEAALLRIAVNPPPLLLDQLQSDERGLLRAVNRILPDNDSATAQLLLVVDQFEELFTLVSNEAIRKQFLNSLHTAVSEPNSPLRAVITLRADFYDRPLLYAGFGDLLRRRMETVLPLSPDELEQAISGPAGRIGAVLEPGLVPFIIADVQEQPGSLPLMQYALTELFEHRQGHRLTLEAYQTSGGVMGALARRADELYEELDTSGRAAVRRLFLRLVTLGDGVEDTRRRVLRAELTSLDGRRGTDNEQMATDTGRRTANNKPMTGDEYTMESVIDTFGRYRLLTFDRDPATRSPTVEVAHEALIREWGRLQAWLDEDREFLLWQQRLRAILLQWQENSMDDGALLRGAPLAEAENWYNRHWADLIEIERAFIQDSLTLREKEARDQEAQRQRELEAAQKLAEAEKQRAEEQARVVSVERQRVREQDQANLRLRWLAIGLAVFLFAAIGAAILAWQQAERAEQQARLTAARELTSAATNNLNVDPELSILLALEAIEATYHHDGTVSQGAEEALHQALYASRVKLTLTTHTDFVAEVDLSSDGTRLATASFDGTAKVWDAHTGQELLTLNGHNSVVFDVMFSPDGTRLVTGGYDHTAKVWDAQSGQQLITLTNHKGEINGVAYSPDGTRLATASFDGTAKVWDAHTGQDLLTLTGHRDQIWDVNFSPDGTQLATASIDGTAKIWNAKTGQEQITLSDHVGQVTRVAFSPNGKYLATAGEDRTARLWDVASGKEILSLADHPGVVLYVRFSPDGTRLATSSGGKVKIWQLDFNNGENVSSREIISLAGHTNHVLGVDFSPDGTFLATGSFDGTARLWDLAPTSELLTLSGHKDEVNRITFNSDGTRLATASDDATAKVWDVSIASNSEVQGSAVANTQRELLTLTGHSDVVHDVVFSADGSRLATASADKTVKVWDAYTGQQLLTLSGHTAGLSPRAHYGITGVAFNPEGTRLATAADDGTARIWDVATGQMLLILAGQEDAVPGLPYGGIVSVSFSPDGRTLATAAGDGTARIWDTSTGQELSTLTGGSSVLMDIAFDPNGTRLASGSWDGLVKVWDISAINQSTVINENLQTPTAAAANLELLTLTGHDSFTGISFSPDGERLATANDSGLAQLWDIPTGQRLLTLPKQGGSINDVAFSPDGRHLATTSGRITRLYVLTIDELVELAKSRVTRSLTTEECQQFLYLDKCPEEL